MVRADRKYQAFISYSHADRAAGARLFALIDGFRPPKSLIGIDGAFGPVPAKLYPCFRDREELAASRDVKTSLDAALSNADHLVVLCSPNAAKSTWIDHEIRSFARQHGASRIHVVLISGEPDASLPPALAEVGIISPLAADLRDHADGWKDGPLKTIAAILGVSFGELRDREATRMRARQRTTATVGALFATVLLGGCGASYVALDQSEQIQEMFNDAMTRAFDEQGVTLTTAQIEEELNSARRFTQAAYRIAPDRPVLLKGEMRLAIVYARQLMSVGKTSEAFDEIRRLGDICSRLAACNTDVEARRLVGTGLRTQAAIEIALHADTEAATRSLNESIRLLGEDHSPESRRELALSHQGLGSIALARRRYNLASEHHGVAAEIISDLIATGHADRDLRHDQVVSLEALGDIAFDQGELQQARVFYQRANQLADRLAQEELDQRSERDLYVTHDRLGLIAVKLGDTEDAYANFDAASRFAIQLSHRDPGNVGLRRDIYISHMQLARVAAMRDERELTRTRLAEAQAIALQLTTQDPHNTEFQADLIRVRIALTLLQRDGLWSEFLLEDASNRIFEYADALRIELPPEVERTLRRSRLRMRPGSPNLCPDQRSC